MTTVIRGVECGGREGSGKTRSKLTARRVTRGAVYARSDRQEATGPDASVRGQA